MGHAKGEKKREITRGNLGELSESFHSKRW